MQRTDLFVDVFQEATRLGAQPLDEIEAGQETEAIEMGTAVPVTLRYSRWLGGDETRDQTTTWRVRMDGMGLIAVIVMPARTVVRYKEQWLQRVLTDEYLIARLVLRVPALRAKS